MKHFIQFVCIYEIVHKSIETFALSASLRTLADLS